MSSGEKNTLSSFNFGGAWRPVTLKGGQNKSKKRLDLTRRERACSTVSQSF